ncbi:glycerophosphodiester phosphodiesterase family protein [Hyunsoonleella flava]|uniref:Glycerophosphodiester phosphodiesterase family protein n=1 Tax=Hyunsoonleella flava TaxID=2527939 RepID=A0A4Q9FG11_9FLAO|nr:glycerophosphodiester phosphodiesterase family protein [Hyunsoonleella flava]TBN00384.1 glycerophosphodiester phosphodiesterase family protein [Hyunsoonleella flava]
MKKTLIIFFVLLCFSCKTEKGKKNVEPVSEEQATSSILLEKFKYSPNAKPLISVHRGGKGIKNYPENCLETLKYINDSIDNAIFEIDVAKTKDDVLVLMHDNTIDRTATGNGNIASFTFKELQAFNLEDDFGNETKFKTPKFREVLQWAKNNGVILTIDIKRSVALENVVDLIREVKAEDVSIIITYDLRQAELANAVAPDLMLSVSARNHQEFEWLLRSGIPTQNMIAFTGTRLSPDSLYAKIHSYGIKTMLGTLGNLDKRAETRGDALYNTWVDKGIDVIATDRPFAVAKALHD